MKKICFSFLMLTAVFAAQAEQRIVADEQHPHAATVSRNGLSRIAIEGGGIASYKFMDGDLEVVKDKATSQLYVRSLTSRKSSLYVVSDEGKTYQLILKPSDKQGDSIIIDVLARKRHEAADAGPPPLLPVTQNTSEYVRAIKQFVVSVMSGASGGAGIRYMRSYETTPLWRDTVFVKTGQYRAADMQADVYSLSNIGADVMVIREQEFYRPDVYAVSVRKQQLQPGDTTEVYVIRKAGG